MDAAHFHLIVNHFPLVLLFVGLILLAAGMTFKKFPFTHAAYVVLILAGLFAVPTFLSGEPAEDILEKTPGFSKTLVHDHEEAAEVTLVIVIATSVLALGALILSLTKKLEPKILKLLLLVLGLVALITTGRTNNLGGKIAHPELRSTQSLSTSVNSTTTTDDD